MIVNVDEYNHKNIVINDIPISVHFFRFEQHQLTMLPGDFPRLHPEHKTAIIFDGHETSYAELDGLANRFANLLLSLGLQPGDRASLLMENDVLMVAAYFGAFRAGIVANPLNHRLSDQELAFILNHAGSRLIITTAAFSDLLSNTLPQLDAAPVVLCLGQSDGMRVPFLSDDKLYRQPATPVTAIAPTAETPALLIYTSGTTGRPKGVVLTQGNVAAGSTAVARGFDLRPEDRTLCMMPLFHTNALMFSHMPFLQTGATVVLRSRFSATQHWRLCEEFSVNSFSASPTILAMLLEHEASAPPANSIHLDYVKVASAPTPPALAERFEARFGQELLLETYGLTETTAINVMNPLRGTRKRGSIGQALPPQQVMIIGDDGKPVPAGTPGEIVVTGPTVMSGYFRDPDATANTIRDGWVRTGDLARMDDDGFIFIIGRKKEMIIRGGENISPLEVEQALMKHPAVREATVVGIADRIWGERVAACVIRRDSIDEEALIEFCRQNLAPFKAPDRILFVDELPRNAMGKIMRKKAAALIQESATT
jgi:long-chain acyl-CoA synthetase